MNALSELVKLFADGKFLLGTAEQLAKGLKHSFARERFAEPLSRFMLEVAEGDVVLLREVASKTTLRLVGDAIWAKDVPKVGRPPELKHIEDGPCDLDDVSWGNREKNHVDSAKLKKSEYTAENHAFMDSLKSEAWIPIKFKNVTKAVVIVGSLTPNYFETRIDRLREYQGFVQSFYHLAALADEYFQKTGLLHDVAAVLPEIGAASSPAVFARAVLTLLTCKHGFRFNRAFYFALTNGNYPATCEFAVGGLGRFSPHWRDECELKLAGFSTLTDYIRVALGNSVPGITPNFVDPLFDEVHKDLLFFHGNDKGAIRNLLEDNPPVSVGEGAATDKPGSMDCQDSKAKAANLLLSARSVFPFSAASAGC